MSPVDLFYGIMISALSAFEVNRWLRVRRSFVPPQPLPKEGPYRSSGGNPGDKAIDMMLDEINRMDEPSAKPVATISSKTPSPEVETIVTLLALEHRVDALLAEVQRQTDRIHELEKRRHIEFKKFGFGVTLTLAVGLGTIITHVILDNLGVFR